MKPSSQPHQLHKTFYDQSIINHTISSKVTKNKNDLKTDLPSIDYKPKDEKLLNDTKITNYFSDHKSILLKTAFKDKPLNYDISSETKAFLNEVSKNPIQRPKVQLTLLDSFSIRDKYQNLLIRKLILPVHYEQLLNDYIKLDKILLSNKKKSKYSITTLPIFNDQILRMLSVIPKTFIITPVDNNPKKIIIEANIDSISRSSLKKMREKRHSAFRKKLLQLVNHEHKKFLLENELGSFNPFKHNTWHSNFNIQKCPEIETSAYHLI